MNKLIICSLTLLSIAVASNAQQSTTQDEPTTTKSVTNISILSPAITHEVAVRKNQTVFLAGALEGVTQVVERGNNTPKTFDAFFGITPVVTVDYRNYYNFAKRQRKNKNTNNNSGNYVALRARVLFDPIIKDKKFPDYNNGLALGGVWGIQRVYRSGIYLGLSLGAGFLIGDIKPQLVSMGDFHLGFNIGSSNKKK